MSRRALVLLLTVARPAPPQSPPAAASDEWAKRAFVEVVASKTDPFVGESIELKLHFGLDADLLANHLVPLFARALDLPVQVEWALDGVGDGLSFAVSEGVTRSGLRGAARSGQSFALGDSVDVATVLGESVRDGRSFQSFELRRKATTTRAGALAIPSATLRFACAEKIEDDLIRGRVPLDRSVVRVEGAGLALNVRALPEEGRPAEFTGAVGRRTLASSASPTRLVVGESLQLSLTITGEGDPLAFRAPDLSHLAGFALRGVLESHSSRVRMIVYDLAPLDERVHEIPSLAFAWFSPDAPIGYVMERTAPIALTVAPRVAGEGAEARPAASTDEGGRTRRIAALAAAGVAILAAFLFVIAKSPRRSGAPRDAASARGGPAAATFRARLAAPDADVAAAFVDYLAARLGVEPAAVVDPDLAYRLEQYGVPRMLATDVAVRVAARVAARYSGRAGAPSAPEARAESSALASLFERLEQLDFARPPPR